jgi:hypothetical protein
MTSGDAAVVDAEMAAAVCGALEMGADDCELAA